jgi:hypothetical protein
MVHRLGKHLPLFTTSYPDPFPSNSNSHKAQFQFAAIVGGNQTTSAPTLYTHLIQRPEYTTPEQRQRLMRRIRECMVKLVSIAGVCKPLDAIFDIDAVTRPEDKDYSFSR